MKQYKRTKKLYVSPVTWIKVTMKTSHWVCGLLVAVCMVMVGCNRPNHDPKIGHSKFHKVAEYLYEITYKGVDESIYATLDEFTTAMPAACSSVRRGNFHGRNLDLYYSDCAEVVVHMDKGDDHYASIGVCGSLLYTPTLVEHFMTSDLFDLLPFITMDGINENGVVCNVNVVPARDMMSPKGTNPGAPKLFFGASCRYILDHAKSAHHAIELLRARDLYGDGFGNEFQFHLMISDMDSTMIVELIDNKMVVTAHGPYSEENVMTNYFCNLPDYTPHAQGIERAELLREHYNEAINETRMMNLMAMVKYTNLYRADTDPYWYSDLTGVFEHEGKTYDVTLTTPQADKDKVKEAMIELFNKKYPKDRDYTFWQTMHTSVYSIEERRLIIAVQEEYWHQYGFTL